MLAKLGCSYVVVGHSERREYHARGRRGREREGRGGLPQRADADPVRRRAARDPRGRRGRSAHCTAQVAAALAGITAEQAETIVVAYEPIWAIGTGKVATPEDAQEVCAAMRAQAGASSTRAELAAGVRVLYGGSVKAANAARSAGQADVDGALVGGASLDGAEFAAICVAARCRPAGRG